MSFYTLNVTLAHIRPKIWRLVRVPGDMSLGGLHEVLQVAFEWQDSHLHDFEVGKLHYGVPDPEDDRAIADEEDISVARALPHKTSTMRYVYDFGDSWIHNITVDSIDDASPKRGARSLSARGPTAPIACLAGACAAPPEDCGGPFGYAEFLEAIASLDHPRHDELLEWVGGEFDAERFSLSDVNRALSAMK